MDIVFKETPIFTRQVTDLLTDDEYKELQAQLVENPSKGAIMQGTGGCPRFVGQGIIRVRVVAFVSFTIG